jgi:uncharacterized membrane protein YbhN (UPF0104 family)
MRKTGKALLLFLTSILLLFIGFWIAGADKALQEMGRFPVWAMAGILAAFGLNLAGVALRLWRLLAHFGIRLPFAVVLRASLQGHFAALFVISLFGQVAGRHGVLRQHGVSSVAIAMLTVIERFFMLLVGGGLCLFGLIRLTDDNRIAVFFSDISLAQIALIALLSLIGSLWLGRTTFEKILFARLASMKNLRNFLETGATSLLTQGVTLLAFVLAGTALSPEAKFADLLAAAVITSFAASMPISIGGWGVRELAAVFAFGLIGMPASQALAISVLVGLCSTAIILVAYIVMKNGNVVRGGGGGGGGECRA